MHILRFHYIRVSFYQGIFQKNSIFNPPPAILAPLRVHGLKNERKEGSQIYQIKLKFHHK